MCLVSFILPAYKARFLRQAISSIVHQSYANWELVVIDDASIEDIEGIVNTFSDNRIRYYRNVKNIGGRDLVEQWNHCIDYAEGEYLILAADDDIYDENFLKSCLTLAQANPTVDIIRARVSLIDEQNNLIGIDGLIPTFTSKYAFLYYWLRATILTCIGNYMFKSTAIKEAKFVNFPSAFCSDAASTIRLSENGVANTEEMLFSFRISSIHLSSNKTQLSRKLTANTQFYNWLLNLKYEQPVGNLDLFFFKENNIEYIYNKCKYDYYNQVIRHLPWYKFSNIWKCHVLVSKDKIQLLLRFFIDKFLRSNLK